jgi:hypothetical protein
MLYDSCEQDSVAEHSALHALHTLCSAQHLNFRVSLMLQSYTSNNPSRASLQRILACF